MAFKPTYSTMFDPPEEMHSRFEAALAEVRKGLGATHPRHVGGRDVPAARTLKVAEAVETVPPPTEEELRVLRDLHERTRTAHRRPVPLPV